MAVQFLSICGGAAQGSILSGMKSGVDRALDQESLTFQGINGAFYADRTISQINQALQVTGRLPCSSSFKYAVRFTPVLLAFVKGRNLVPQCLKNSIDFSQRSLLIVAQVANVVSSVALIAFGQPFFGTASLLFLTLGALDQNRLLPSRVMRVIDEYVQPVILIVGLVTGEAITKVLSLVLLVDSAANQRFSPQKIAPKSQLNAEKCNALLANSPLKINRQHVHYFAEAESLQQKVLNHLKTERTNQYKLEVQELMPLEFFQEILLASCVDRCGITYEGAAEPDIFSKLITARILEHVFWKEQNLESMTYSIQKALLSGKIETKEITQFWEEWTKKQPTGTSNPKLSRSVYDDQLIRAMLYDFGILI